MLFTSSRGSSRSLGFIGLGSVLVLVAGAILQGACSAAPPSNNGDGDGDGDGGGDGDICLASCGDGDIGGDGDLDPGDGDGDDKPKGDYCDDFEIEWEPRTPTVYVLVDASSSMTELGFWEPMRTGVLEVVQELTADVRFGFGSYTGTQLACTGLTNATPTLSTNNYEQIAAAYNAIPAPPVSMDPAVKQETPTPAAIQAAAEILLTDDSPGDRYILLVSDGEPDFCNDTTANCAVDGTVAAIQHAHSQGVTTLVFAIDSVAIANPQYFDYFAQAGVGQQPSWPVGLNIQADGYSGQVASECTSAAIEFATQWAALRTANGNAPDPEVCPPQGMGNQNCFLPAGDYSAAGGTATAILNSDPAALAEQILASVSGLKSCVIELDVDVVNTDEGDIFVNDMETPIPQDQWRMNDTYVLELLGDACTLWQQPDVFNFFAGFPCAAVVVR